MCFDVSIPIRLSNFIKPIHDYMKAVLSAPELVSGHCFHDEQGCLMLGLSIREWKSGPFRLYRLASFIFRHVGFPNGTSAVSFPPCSRSDDQAISVREFSDAFL